MSLELDLAGILAPVTVEDFLVHNWQQKLMVVQHGRATRFSRLLSLRDVEYLISSLALADGGWLMLVRNCKTQSAGIPKSKDQTVDLAAVREAYASGDTILLTKVQRRWESLGSLCRSIELELIGRGIAMSQHIGANIYLTPANARAFPAHYDDHDVLVLQLEGCKRWNFYDCLEPYPVRRQTEPLPQDLLPPLQSSATIEPGDMLYIPRGVYHEAITGDEYSLHVTLSVYPYTWLDLCARVTERHAVLRQAIPRGLLRNPETLSAMLRERLSTCVQAHDTATCALAMFHECIDSLDPLPDDGLRQIELADDVNCESLVERHKSMMGRLEVEDSGGLRLLFGGGGVRGPSEMLPVFEFVLREDQFIVAALPDVLCDESKVDLVKQLVRGGLLRIARPIV